MLQSVEAESLVSDDLRTRIQTSLDQITTLRHEASQLRERVENIYPQVQGLDEEHIRLLETRFPGDLPETTDYSDVALEFNEMTGQEDVFRAFHDVLRVLHNTVPAYPNETRDRR